MPADEPKPDVLPAMPPRGEVQRSDEPPVVARMVIEIRSDGSRTIARGALEDVSTGQRAAIEAQGTSPLQLAFALARSLGTLPRLTAKSALRGLLGGRKK